MSRVHNDLALLGESITDFKPTDPHDIQSHADEGKTIRVTAEITGLTLSAVRTYAKRLGVSFLKPDKTYRHGTPYRYPNGCRCDDCRKANALKAQESRQKRLKKTPPEHVHGTSNGYVNWGVPL